MKLIIATTLSGLFIKKIPWTEAHRAWFERMVEETGDESFLQWIVRKDYFEGVNLAMAKIMPDASKEERIREARKRFMGAVVSMIREKKEEMVNREIADFFRGLKKNYQLALITTNTKDSVDEILSIAGLGDLFDIIEVSLPEEEDDKVAVFERFIQKNGKPVIYFGGDRKDSYEFCRQRNIFCVFANLEGGDDLSVRTVHNLEEMKKVIQELSS